MPLLRLPLPPRLPRLSLRLPHSRWHSTTPPRPRLSFHPALSYASKDSPPFLPPLAADQKAATSGFQNGDVGRWWRGMLELGGGREELLGLGGGAGSKEGLSGVERRRKWGAGEDAFFVAFDEKTHLALSDGVGGWASSHIDPSLFSQSLMYHAFLAAKEDPDATVGEILEEGFGGVGRDGGVKAGSATATIVSLDSTTHILQAANLGDSGYMIIRDGKIFWNSTPQTHYFNCPRQLAKLPKSMKGQGSIEDMPRDADITEWEIKGGDMVVVYTDGLSDNLPLNSHLLLLSHVHKTLALPQNDFLLPQERNAETARLYADMLVGYARVLMGKEDVKSPFEEEAAKHGLRYKGGKVDDITVITAFVTEADPES